ncbi:hypothetical protein M569_01724, partial [Genlisea aurea]
VAPRILLAGDAVGRLSQLFKRVASVNKASGPFDVLLCVGQFFPESPDQFEEFNAYAEGRLAVPIPTYFIGDYGFGAAKILSAVARESSNLGFKMDGLKVCDNLYWLRGSGKFTLHGLTVAYLSGRKATGEANGQFGDYTQDDVDSLRAFSEDSGIILASFDVRFIGVANTMSGSLEEPPVGDSTVSKLVAEIKPRYHIAGTSSVYYDREPYTNVGAAHVTRFIALASVGNKDKQKFIHALSPTPAAEMSAAEISAKPPNTTLSPYRLVEDADSHKRPLKGADDTGSDEQYWRYDVSQKRRKHEDGESDKLCFKYVSSGSCPRGENCRLRHDEDARKQSIRGVCFDFLNKGKCERGPSCRYKHSIQEEDRAFESKNRIPHSFWFIFRSKECWFCLSSPNVESHLIASVGEYFYCALAKGPLVEDHVLLVPIEHLPNTLRLQPECERELHGFQSALRAYFKSQNQEVVFFEWISSRGTHANLQAVPIPLGRASSVEQIFTLAAERLGFTFETLKDDENMEGRRKLLGTHIAENRALFYAEAPGGTILLHLVEENEKFPVQFGREVVIAGLLNVADKADWRNCQLSKDEEETMSQRFRTRFTDYDPN